MAVFRVEKTKNYTVMSNHHLQDSSLSLKTKGLLTIMLSLPEDWDYTEKGLCSITGEGKDSIRTCLKQLEASGYLIRRQLRGESGRMGGTEYIISEVPMSEEPMSENPTTVNPTSENPASEEPMSDNPPQLKTKAPNTVNDQKNNPSIHPKKYLLGVTDDQYDAVINDKFKQYVGSIITATTNPDTGEKPTFGQLTQGSIAPHVEMIRILATQFSAATGLPVTDTGVVNDANPTSSDAIEAQTKTLVGLAEDLNVSNGDSLRMIARMALAIANETTLEDLTEDQLEVVAHFKNPAMPSVAATTDAAIKLASAREGFSSTDVFLEMVGFSQADIRRIKAQEQRVRGLQVLEELNLEELNKE